MIPGLNDGSPRLVSVTPELAKYWMENCNSHNRALSPTVVKKYASDMSAGLWKPTHQGIAFSPKGILLDGQHRLAAIIESGATIDLYVFGSIDAGSQLVIDQHRIRDGAAALTLNGGAGIVTNEELAVLRAMARGLTNRTRRSTLQQELASLIVHREAIAFAMANIVRRGGVKGISSGTTRAVVARAYYSADRDRLQKFCGILTTGIATENSTDSSALLLWSWLVQSQNNGCSTAQMKERYGKVERALSAFLRKEKIAKLYAATQELFPLPEETDPDEDDDSHDGIIAKIA